MKYEIIKTENYLLVVDDSEIKEGDYRVNIQRGYIKLVDDNPEYYNKRNDVFKKVIAHLPLNNSPILRDVDLLPPLEEETDVEKRVLAFIAGYNKAKETYKYTEEDVIRIVEKSRETGLTAEYLMLSPSQPKIPIGFECQTFDTGDDKLDGTHVLGIRTTTNSQGQSVWVGEYIYA